MIVCQGTKKSSSFSQSALPLLIKIRMSTQNDQSIMEKLGEKCYPEFPDVIDGKIGTEEFLAASRETIKMIEKFGKIFASIKYDMQSNINKLTKKYLTDKENYATLQDMIFLELQTGRNSVATEALLWLKRGLHMIQLFFENIVHDHKRGNLTEDLVAYLKKSYKQALEPFHGWMAQQLFELLSKMIPNRTQFLQILANGLEGNEKIMQKLDTLNQKLKLNILTLEEFYKQYV